MSSKWDDAEGMAEKAATSGGIFVRLQNDGDKVVGAFCGEPFAKEVLWTGERYVAFDPNDQEHRGKKPTVRFTLNFFVPAEDAMKVIEGGVAWFKDVLKVRKKYGLDRKVFEIERHGASGDSRTQYSILPEGEIDADLRARMTAAELHDLERLSDAGSADEGKERRPAPAPTPAPARASGPIDLRVAGEFVARLKALGAGPTGVFLEQFHIQRIRDLKTSDEAGARALLQDLETEAAQAKAVPQEVNPWEL